MYYIYSVIRLTGCLWWQLTQTVWFVLYCIVRYDPDRDQWQLVAPMLTRRIGVGVAVISRLLYAVGGFDGTHRLSSSECYNPDRDEWKTMTAMNTVRSGAGEDRTECCSQMKTFYFQKVYFSGIKKNNLIFVLKGNNGLFFLNVILFRGLYNMLQKSLQCTHATFIESTLESLLGSAGRGLFDLSNRLR